MMLLLADVGDSVQIAVESREKPIQKIEQMEGKSAVFEGTARPGEFFVFQIALHPRERDFGPIAFKGELSGGATMRCISLTGIDHDGRPLSKVVNVPRGTLQVLWVGVEVPKTASGDLAGACEIGDGKSPALRIPVTLQVKGEPVQDGGDSDPGRLSRLRWLDSQVGAQPTVTRPFIPVRAADAQVHVLGRSVKLDGSGLPAQITSSFNANNTRISARGREMLAAPMRFVVSSAQGPLSWESKLGSPDLSEIAAKWSARNSFATVSCDVSAEMGFDGRIEYKLKLTARDEVSLDDIALEIPLRKDIAKYQMGLGEKGGLRKADLHWTWDVKKYQDALWIGDVNAGMLIRFKGSNYRRPLLNVYYNYHPLNLPDSWGSGGVDVVDEGERVLVRAYSGKRTLKPGESLDFNFDLYLTPFKPIDTDEHWATRYAHSSHGSERAKVERAFDHIGPGGVNYVNIHHANPFAPFINYPYHPRSMPDLKDLIGRLRTKNARAGIYYTTREITNHMPELFALHSMNGEVIFPGPGASAASATNPRGADPWLVENLRNKFIPAWRQKIPPPYDSMDLAVITTPDSRWNNFFLQGLKYLCDELDIDGIYIDDTALDRTSLQRARRILDERPGRLIDLHSWNHMNARAGFANCAIIYTELFPYLDRIWFGEGFRYNEVAADYWLVEISGIPFGLMSEMLQGGGNPGLGMLYGMTNRLLWTGDPRPVWKVWDEFGMAGCEMIGYWDPACPVKTGRDDVFATVYRHKDRAMISIGNFSSERQTVKLAIDWAALGLDPTRVSTTCPAIEKIQDASKLSVDDPIKLEAKRGMLIIIRQ
jgi:hypothetical protein